MENALKQDQEQLKLLSIFHYVVGGITAIFALFPVFHLIFGLIMIIAPSEFENGSANPARFVGWFFVLIALAIIAVGWTIAGLIIASGRFLSKRRHYLYCMIIAGLECLFMPFGTVLGVFTIIVLSRESVKGSFAS